MTSETCCYGSGNYSLSPSHHWRSSAVPDSSCKITSDQCLSPWVSGLLVGFHRGIISHRGGAGELTDICLQSAEVKYIHEAKYMQLWRRFFCVKCLSHISMEKQTINF